MHGTIGVMYRQFGMVGVASINYKTKWNGTNPTQLPWELVGVPVVFPRRGYYPPPTYFRFSARTPTGAGLHPLLQWLCLLSPPAVPGPPSGGHLR